MSGTYEQPALPVADPGAFQAVRSAIEGAFSSAGVASFLRAVERAGVRIRDFETVLARGVLGTATEADYGRLGNGDRGQIREFYLASLEHVVPELRRRYFKLYAYY